MEHDSYGTSSSNRRRLAAAEAIVGNGDLVTEILLRLPSKPLTQFKSVSKHWLSLISDPQFSLHHATRRRRRREPAAAIFLRSADAVPEFTLVPFDGCPLPASHFRTLSVPGTTILDSCNGLLCYSRFDDVTCLVLRYYIFNPTTRRSARIPLLGLAYDPIDPPYGRGDYRVQHKLCNSKVDQSTRPWSELNITLLGVYVAFDPLLSPHYRVVCVWEWSTAAFNYQIRLAVYSSETGLWGELMGPFKVPRYLCFEKGVFWNRRVHWISNTELAYFDLEGGYLRIMLLPLSCRENKVAYFGESRDRLHIVVRLSNAVLNVFELERDYSGWVSVFGCDLSPVIASPLEAVFTNMPGAFSLLYLCRGESKDESFLVVGASHKLISYNVEKENAKELCDLPQSACHKAFPYDETLFEV